MSIPRRIFLNLGPCTTSERVQQALLMSDLCPREREFGALLTAVRTKLPRVADGDATHTAVLLAGEARTFRLADIGDLCPDDMRVALRYLAGHMAARRIFL